MLSANVYSVEALPPAREKAIYDGLDLVGQYVGTIVSPRTLRVRLPKTSAGRVNPERVSYGKLPKEVDLHVFAVPMEATRSARLGLGYSLTGVSYVDSTQEEKVTRITAAHEAAHSLGFVLNHSAQLDPQSTAHCCDGGCIMHKSLTNVDAQIFPLPGNRLGNTAALGQTQSATREMFGLPQDDFCKPCQNDMNDFGDRNLAALRVSRLLTGMIIPRTAVVIDLPR